MGKYSPDDVVCVIFEDITSYRNRDVKEFKKLSCIECRAYGRIYSYDVKYMKLINLESDDVDGISDGIAIPSGCIIDIKNYVCPEDQR